VLKVEVISFIFALPVGFGSRQRKIKEKHLSLIGSHRRAGCYE